MWVGWVLTAKLIILSITGAKSVEIELSDPAVTTCNLTTQFARAEANGTVTCHLCSETPPGHRKAMFCYGYSDAEFEPCPRGRFNTGEGDECRRCRKKCGRGFVATKKCSRTRDLQCERCPRGKFANALGVCETCRSCGHGRYVWLECNSSRNTVCKRCPTGYYSNINDAARCFPCGSCSGLTKILRPCKPKHDMKCGGCIKGYYMDHATGECKRCSYCYPNRTVVIDECTTDQGLVDTQYVCMLVRRPIGDDPSGIFIETKTKEDGGSSVYLDMTIPLISAGICVVGLGLCILFIFLLIFKSRQMQYRLRQLRDLRGSCRTATRSSIPSIADSDYQSCALKSHSNPSLIGDLAVGCNSVSENSSAVFTFPMCTDKCDKSETSSRSEIGRSFVLAASKSLGSLQFGKSAGFQKGIQSRPNGSWLTDTDASTDTERASHSKSAVSLPELKCAGKKRRNRRRKRDVERKCVRYCVQ